MHDLLKQRFGYKNIIPLVAVAVFFITAWNSHGFYHADEHYQIIEFAGIKLGTHTPDELAWEYGAQIRPALQPSICFVLLKVLNQINITDPYIQAFSLRLLTAFLALIFIRSFIKKTEGQFENNNTKKIYYLLSYFLWFIPVISVRFSSETWSGLFFLSALTLFLIKDKQTSKPFLAGILLGFSFLFRFQIAFALIGLLLWLLIIERVNLRYLAKLALGFFLIIFIGFLIDSWFYGKPLFTPWNYFQNFYSDIMGESAPAFGTTPWYYYLSQLLKLPGYFIGVPLFISFVILIIFKPKNLILWCIIPFIIIHSMISHKEERFLFRMVYLFPYILVTGYEQIRIVFKNKILVKLVNYFLAILFISTNLTGLIVMAQKSAGIGRMAITKHIHDRYKNRPVNLIYCSWANPYNPWNGIPEKFYLEKNMTDRRINNLCELNDSLIVSGAVNFLVGRKIDFENQECSNIVHENNFNFEKQSIPNWIECINEKYKGFENKNILMLYKYAGK